MAIIPRFARLFLLVLLALTIPTLYILYKPSSSTTSSSSSFSSSSLLLNDDDKIRSYEAGGIDSDHYREPVGRPVHKPNRNQNQNQQYENEELIRGDRERESEITEENRMDREMGIGKTGFEIADQVLAGGVIMGKMENATAKAELGRAAWKLLHLMTLRFPDEPTPEDRQALKSYFHLFSRLYPCGECATEFQALLKQYPPQTSSRKVASLWLCHVHNQVNARLGKPEFDCLTLDATYDCGCGDDPLSLSASSSSASTSSSSSFKSHPKDSSPDHKPSADDLTRPHSALSFQEDGDGEDGARTILVTDDLGRISRVKAPPSPLLTSVVHPETGHDLHANGAGTGTGGEGGGGAKSFPGAILHQSDDLLADEDRLGLGVSSLADPIEDEDAGPPGIFRLGGWRDDDDDE